MKKKETILKRIVTRKKYLDYDNFGKVEVSQKDDLQMISGIDPFIEEKLKALDIYTLEQISKFNKRDIEEVNYAIEYFPGRIERNEWLAQAKELEKQKSI